MRCQAVILRQVLLEGRLDQTCLHLLTGEAREATQAVFDRRREDPVETSRQFGNNCHLPGSYQGALQAFLHHHHHEEQDQDQDQDQQYQDTIRAVVRGGGCNCSRGNYAGALLGAARGSALIPQDWLERINQAETMVETLITAANIVISSNGKHQ